ncbi:MAG TPA: S-layer homology domain-containing protein [Chloroflexia bacterium]|nr:S-layer homology domain-containing protein [Chloroflexia bacterium]
MFLHKWMHQTGHRRAILGLVLMLAIAAAAAVLPGKQSPAVSPSAPLGAAPSNTGAPAADNGPSLRPVGNGIMVGQPSVAHVSPALSSLKSTPRSQAPRKSEQNEVSIPHAGHVDQPDGALQNMFRPLDQPGMPNMPGPIKGWEGMGFAPMNNGAPPDTNGEVGPNHYVQMVNSTIAVWDKQGNLQAGPLYINELWSNAFDACYFNNDGDPIVMYDQLADRWLLSQFTASAPYHECIAVSQTGNAAGNYWVYSFQLSSNDFPDYPHFGVWPDGYYMTVNQFNGGQTYAGSRAYVFERDKMLNGQTANFQTTNAPQAPALGYLLPADLDGSTPPPAGAPNYLAAWSNNMAVFRYHVDWANPANSTLSQVASLPVAAFTELCPSTQNCLPQLSTTNRLDGLGDRLMFRAAYRNFGTHESLVLNHSVNANNYAGIRWYELRGLATTPTIYQQGTYAPTDGNHRWVGSAAMDRSGNIAVGYSVTGSGMYPAIRYTGRLAGDPLGTLPQGEATLKAGTGAQLDPVHRWGDYSDLTVDPTDDCTFWYTTEYLQTNADFGWNTYIGAFKFPSCGQTTPPTATPRPTNTPGPQPPTATPRPGATATATPPAGSCQISFSDVPNGSPFYAFVQCLACQNIVGGYSDGTFRPGANVTRGQLSKFVANAAGYQDAIPAGQQTFTDVPNTNPFWVFIERVAAHGVVGGYSDGTFRPNNNVTRGQVAKFVSNAADYQDAIPASRQTFSDVPSSDTFWLFIERVYAHGVVGGYADGTFRPTANVTRGQTSKFISNTFFPNCQVAR